MGNDDGLQVHGRQRWETELRAEKEQSVQSTSNHVLEKVWYEQIREQKGRKGMIESEWHCKGDLVRNLQGTPARPDLNREQLMVPIRVRFDPPQEDPDPTMQHGKESQVRRMKITEIMFQKYGGRRAKAAGMTQKLRGEACRKRKEQALDRDEAGRELRRKNTEHENQSIADKMRHNR